MSASTRYTARIATQTGEPSTSAVNATVLSKITTDGRTAGGSVSSKMSGNLARIRRAAESDRGSPGGTGGELGFTSPRNLLLTRRSRAETRFGTRGAITGAVGPILAWPSDVLRAQHVAEVDERAERFVAIDVLPR